MVREFTGVLSSLSSLKGLHIVCKSIDASKNCLASTLGHELEAVVLANAKTLKSLTVDLQSIHGINLLFSHQMTTEAHMPALRLDCLSLTHLTIRVNHWNLIDHKQRENLRHLISLHLLRPGQKVLPKDLPIVDMYGTNSQPL